jgi:hypothetical protein
LDLELAESMKKFYPEDYFKRVGYKYQPYYKTKHQLMKEAPEKVVTRDRHVRPKTA